jgi:polysaccharide biosynthesis transport protein
LAAVVDLPSPCAALARAGRRVVLVDLDLRRASLHRLFGLGDLPGVTDVAVGRVTLAEALVQIPLSGTLEREAGSSLEEDVLELLPAGQLPPNPGEFIQTRAIGTIISALAERADTVLIDAAPLLAVADAVALTAQVDAVLAVARLNVVRRPMLRELRRVLDSCPAHKLGVVLTDAEDDMGYGYDAYGAADLPALALGAREEHA